MRGRKPTPRVLKAAKGNPGRRPIGEEPKVKMGAPPCPADLPVEAKKEWKRIAPMLAKAGLLSHVDRAALSAYCTAYARWRKAETQLDQQGLVVKSPNGHLIMHPLLPIANKAMEQMKGFLVEFGMTPSSRSRVSPDTDGNSNEDETDKFFTGPRKVG